jgi:hypothetical protein
VKGKDGIQKETLVRKKVKVINRDFFVFAFFLLLSFMFWYLNSLSKEVEAGIKYPFEYINIPKEREIKSNSPEKIDLFLKGPGYSILKLKLSGNKPPVQIDIAKVSYRRVPGSKTLSYFIITSGLAKSLTVQIRSGCEITSIKPDTLFFTLDKTALKPLSVTTGKRKSGKLI